MAIYAYPDVGRTGLGNMLFPWARAEVFAARHGLRILSPRWTQPKIGPLLRREKDLRYYVGLFDSTGYVRGVRRAVVLARAKRIAAADGERFMASAPGDGRTAVVVFSGWEGWFDGLLPFRELVSTRLQAMLSRRVRECLSRAELKYDVAVHVRRGDKVPIAFGQAMSGASSETLSDQWYINTIRSVRKVMGESARVAVFSDARAEQIGAILKEPNVVRAPDQPSIVDILMLSRARVLIGTGGSSFSAWASYLGAMPTIWYPGTGLALIEGKPELSIEGELDGSIAARGVRQIEVAAGR